MPESRVIFICLADPLGEVRPRYELRTACINESSVAVDDGAQTILLNAGSWEREENSEVAGMLQIRPDERVAGV